MEISWLFWLHFHYHARGWNPLTRGLPPSRSSLDPDGHPPRQTSRSSAAPMPPSPAQKVFRKNVAVLSVNLTGFMDLLLAANEGVTTQAGPFGNPPTPHLRAWGAHIVGPPSGV